MSLVEVEDVFRLYASPEGTAVALRGLSLAVEEGELVVVFGPSGSGKTTLLRLLAGLEQPTAGSIRVAGHDLRTLRGGALAAYRSRLLGYADQHYARVLAPELTARRLVSLRLALLGEEPARQRDAAERLLDRVGLADRADARPHELSGGEQQRLAVCAALAHRPRLFVADEPTGELDAANAETVYRLIAELAKATGTTTVVVSHDPASARIADRVVQIRDGRVSSEGERAVVNRGGWIRVPEAHLGGATRVRFAAQGDALRLELDGRRPASPAAPPPRARRGGDVVARVERLAKVHGAGAAGVQAFAGVTAAFRAGELAVVTGPSGSGKSTLLRLLAGLDTPTAGDVFVLEHHLSAAGRAARADVRRRLVGLVSQGTDLVPFLTAREAVELGLALRGVDRDEVPARARAALGAVGLEELVDQRVERLSMGERQRVAVARALAARPPLLLADEPTALLDEANARAIGALFAELASATGTAVVCATHDPVLVEQASVELPLRPAA